jgi:hypothetical protein
MNLVETFARKLLRELVAGNDFQPYWDQDASNMIGEFLEKVDALWKDQDSGGLERFKKLLRDFCLAEYDLNEHFRKFRERNAATKHQHIDDDDCTGFDEMEAHEFWSAELKAKIRRSKRALAEFWAEKIDKQPIVRPPVEDHNSSDCDSTCSDCEEKHKRRKILKPKVMQNPGIGHFVALLRDTSYGRKITVTAQPFSVDRYLEGYCVSDETVKLQFIKSHHKRGILRQQNMWVIYHSGQLEDVPKLCPYFLPTRSILVGDKYVSRPDDPDHVKILVKDEVFEYYHRADGFLIPNSEIY